MQQQYETLAHCRWECKYHLVFIPKYRKKVLFGHVRKRVGQILKTLIGQKPGMELIEGHVLADHVHMCVSIPPKYAVASGWAADLILAGGIRRPRSAVVAGDSTRSGDAADFRDAIRLQVAKTAIFRS